MYVFDSEFCSVEPAVLTNSKEEFEIPEQVFDCVYGTDGSNLVRMEQVKLYQIVHSLQQN